MFSFPDEKFQHLGGGIVKSEGDPSSRSRKANLLYLYVHDIEEMIAVGPLSYGFARLISGFAESKGSWR